MVKQGYKQTEIGLIPNDWNIVSIEKLATDMSDGPFGSNLKKEHYTDDKQARIIQLSNIGENGWLDTNVKYTTFSHAKTISRCIVNPGHIIVAKMMPAGRAIICPSMEKMYVLGSDSIKLELNATLVNTKYFMYSTKSSFFQTQIKEETQGSTRARTSISKLRKNKVLLPSIEEQNRIAEALSDADSMISSLEKLITKKKAVKQGAMQELLTGKKRLPGFAGEWKSILLEDVCVFYNGGTPSKKRSDWWNGCIPWISSSDLCENSITSVSINRYITQDALDHSATHLCPKNAVSIVSRVGVGKVAVTPCELCTSQDFTTIVSSHNPYFLAYMLVPIMKDMAMQAQGTSIKGITVEDIAKIKISTPSIKEQNQIVSILSDMDNEIEALKHKLEKMRQIKQGMMQQLLTGKIRLV